MWSIFKKKSKNKCMAVEIYRKTKVEELEEYFDSRYKFVLDCGLFSLKDYLMTRQYYCLINSLNEVD